MQYINGETHGEERAFYNLRNTKLNLCRFEGEEDGESALKEARNIEAENCDFLLRYPLWHNDGLKMKDCRMSEACRAALWYTKNAELDNCRLGGIKCLRECENIKINETQINSVEFGWKSKGLSLTKCKAVGEYIFLNSKDIVLDGFELCGKYSFQYTENVKIENSVLDTKDAFWHAENVYVKNCIIKGEYLAWYSKNISFENCKIIGTQPLCYCKGLKLINCTMENTDLSFEYSQVDADIKGNIVSVKNVLDGKIVADSIGSVINEDSIYDCKAEIVLRNNI